MKRSVLFLSSSQKNIPSADKSAEREAKDPSSGLWIPRFWIWVGWRYGEIEIGEKRKPADECLLVEAAPFLLCEEPLHRPILHKYKKPLLNICQVCCYFKFTAFLQKSKPFQKKIKKKKKVWRGLHWQGELPSQHHRAWWCIEQVRSRTCVGMTFWGCRALGRWIIH